MVEQSASDPVNTLIQRQSWEELKEMIANDPARYSTYNRIVNIDPLDEWFDMTYGYPLNATQWFERQVLARHIGDSTFVYSQYLMKIESKKDSSTFRNAFKPVSMQIWLSNNPERFTSYLMFQGGYVGIGDHHEFVIKDTSDKVVERFTIIPDSTDANGYKKWYRQMKEVTKTLKFDPPAK